MAFIVTRINVGDYETWKTMFDRDEPGARQGATGYRVLRGADNPNEVFILVEFASLEDAQDRRERLLASGVLDRFDDKDLPRIFEEADAMSAAPDAAIAARTSTWSGSSEALDRWEEHVVARVCGFVASLQGNAGGGFFIDRDAGTALTLTLWDTEGAAAETDKFADQSRASTIEATGVQLLDRGSYRVVKRF